MDSSIGTLLLVQIVLIALNAIFACAETAIISINDNKMAKMAADGDKNARRLMELTKGPANFLSTIQICITLSGFLGSAFAADNFSEPLVDWLISMGVPIPSATLDTMAVIAITLILSYFTLIFGELVPKRIAMKKAETLALKLSGLISIMAKLFGPVVWFLSLSTNIVLQIIGIDPDEEEEEISEEEIRMLVDVGTEKGTIDTEEKEFIQNVFEFNDTPAREIVTHRTKLAVLWMEDSMAEWEKTIHDTRHTLYPVCEDTADQVIGILNAKDYFRLSDKNRDNVMQNAVKEPYFVSDATKADVLFKSMKDNHNAMAVIIDEYGGTLGVITINDLVEQLVGDLEIENR